MKKCATTVSNSNRHFLLKELGSLSVERKKHETENPKAEMAKTFPRQSFGG